MQDLIRELIPHAPHLGLFVVPDLPADKVANALRDYAAALQAEDVLALYDATLMGSAKDGAVFTAERLVFQNNDLEAAQSVSYADLVAVREKRRLLGGRRVELDVNRGRATVTLALDFSGKPGAAEYVHRFLREALLRGAAEEMDAPAPSTEEQATDVAAVRRALGRLRDEGRLSDADHARLLRALEAGS